MEIRTNSAAKTQKIARLLAKTIKPRQRGAVVIALEGELGAGKTTFAQGFARALGVKENVLSPTFVLMKIYELRQAVRDKRQWFKHFVHIDCYRLASPRDLLHLGFTDLLKDKDAIILIEWVDRVKKILPRDVVWLKLSHDRKPHQRTVSIF